LFRAKATQRWVAFFYGLFAFVSLYRLLMINTSFPLTVFCLSNYI